MKSISAGYFVHKLLLPWKAYSCPMSLYSVRPKFTSMSSLLYASLSSLIFGCAWSIRQFCMTYVPLVMNRDFFAGRRQCFLIKGCGIFRQSRIQLAFGTACVVSDFQTPVSEHLVSSGPCRPFFICCCGGFIHKGKSLLP